MSPQVRSQGPSVLLRGQTELDFSQSFHRVCLQEFSNFSSLSQSQFSQYYTLPPTYVPTGLPSSDEQGAGVGGAGYSAMKSEEAASAGLPPRGDV